MKDLEGLDANGGLIDAEDSLVLVSCRERAMMDAGV